MAEEKKKSKKLIVVHTGNGKGKTSAAMGMAFRTVAHGGKVAVIQFLKSKEDYKYGEQKLAEQLDNFDIFTMGAGFTWDVNDRETDIRTTRETWEKCKETVLSGEYSLVIWDEINYVIDYDYLDVQEVLEFLEQRPQVHIVLTGRNAKESVIEIADLVTEMKCIKHPYREQNIRAQKGIEW